MTERNPRSYDQVAKKRAQRPPTPPGATGNIPEGYIARSANDWIEDMSKGEEDRYDKEFANLEKHAKGNNPEWDITRIFDAEYDMRSKGIRKPITSEGEGRQFHTKGYDGGRPFTGQQTLHQEQTKQDKK